MLSNYKVPIPVAMLSETQASGRSIAGVGDMNPAEGMNISCVCVGSGHCDELMTLL
jgi:hypothetical protein